MSDRSAKRQIGGTTNPNFHESMMIYRPTKGSSAGKGIASLVIFISLLLAIGLFSAPLWAQQVYYSVQVAAFKSREHADRSVSDLKLEGRDAFWKIAKVKGQLWHRVLVGRFDKISDAESYRRQLEKGASKTFFVRKIIEESPTSQSPKPPHRPLKRDVKTEAAPTPTVVKKAPAKPDSPKADRMAPQPVPAPEKKLPSPARDLETPLGNVEKTIRTEPSPQLPAAPPAPPAVAVPSKVPITSERHFGQRFVDRGDGTISDLRMKLMWIKNGWRLEFFSAVDWHKAVGKCARFKYGGYSDWRLPTLAEWKSIIDPDKEYPALVEPNPFENIIAHMPYWSQTEYSYKAGFGAASENATQAYTVMLYYGNINHQRKNEKAFVLPVRSLK